MCVCARERDGAGTVAELFKQLSRSLASTSFVITHDDHSCCRGAVRPTASLAKTCVPDLGDAHDVHDVHDVSNAQYCTGRDAEHGRRRAPQAFCCLL